MCVCASMCLSMCAFVPSVCVMPRTSCILCDVCDSVRVSVGCALQATRLCLILVGLYFTGVIVVWYTTQRSLSPARSLFTAIANVRHNSILFMSQYLVCMHDESLIEYTEERREARVKLLLPRRGSTRASEIDRNRDRKRVARSLVTELSSRGVQAKSVADLSLGSVASVANSVQWYQLGI